MYADPWDPDNEDEYCSDERFGTQRQADREYNRDMIKWMQAALLNVQWDDGLCSNSEIHPDTWFAPYDTKASAQAAETCFKCPIRLQCLKFACEGKEKDGVWGGLPATIRIGKTHKTRKPHDFDALKELPNPYANAVASQYLPHNLRDWTPGTDTGSEED